MYFYGNTTCVFHPNRHLWLSIVSAPYVSIFGSTVGIESYKFNAAWQSLSTTVISQAWNVLTAWFQIPSWAQSNQLEQDRYGPVSQNPI